MRRPAHLLPPSILLVATLALAGEGADPDDGVEPADMLQEGLDEALDLEEGPSRDEAALPDEDEPALVDDGLPSEAPALMGVQRLPGAGLAFGRAPRLLPGGLPGDDLATVAAAMTAGDTAAALVAAERAAHDLRDRRDRAAAWMAVGMLHRDAGRHNLASEAFTQVRVSAGPLAPWGAWYEAEQDRLRGRVDVALGECERYLTTYPNGPHVDDCEELLPFAHAELGHVKVALEAAAAFDEAHPTERIGEAVALSVAAWELEHDPTAAVARFRRLATWFSAPLTRRVAEQGLAELARRGIPGASLPDDTASLQGRAVSLRETLAIDEAWALYTELARRAADDPALARWVAAEASTFGWRTRQWDFVVDLYRSRLAENPADGESAWLLYRALDRAGRYTDAAAALRTGLARFATHPSWRREEERMARTLLLARSYDRATEMFDAAAGVGGTTGLRNRFYAGFSAAMAGDHHAALSRLDALVEDDKGLLTEARYWRAQVLDRTGEHAGDADRTWVQQHDPTSWYAVLLKGAGAVQIPRVGRWPGQTPTPPTSATVVDPRAVQVGPVAAAPDRPAATGFGAMRWPMVEADPTPPALLAAAPPAMVRPEGDYRTSLFHDPDEASQTFDDFVEAWHDTWPQLDAVRDLARVGLHDLSGPLFARIYDDWVGRLKHRDTVARAVDAGTGKDAWRDLFLYTRDHHHVTRTTWGLDRYAPAEQRQDVAALSLPLAHGRQVWASSRTYDLDPFLVLGLMRTESLYNANAVSRVGARGPMQIMPRTGHLLADLTDDVGFHVAELHDPALAIDYGIRYLGLLLDRFDGVFPLAVAAYNGGPHNVHAWLQGTGADMPMDAVVEHIPYGETRRYVRSVTERYATYVSLYDLTGARVHVPPTPLGDHPEIVDF